MEQWPGPIRCVFLRRRVATRTSISAEACAGTTLVVVPPSNDADVDGGSRGQVLQVLELEDLVGELDDRASAVVGRHAGVGGLAFDVEMEPADALPRGLEPAIGQCRLEHQRHTHNRPQVSR